MTRRTPTALAALFAATAVAALGGCAASSRGSLDAQTATPSPACRVHQTKEPAGRYTAGAHADPFSVLALMRYYTANGAKAFCDGKPPTSTDQHWAALYTRLGGTAGPRPHRAAGTP